MEPDNWFSEENQNERVEWETVMQDRVKSLTAKSANGYIHWITKALYEFNYIHTAYYLDHKEFLVGYKFSNN